jgi:predicted nucleic acid-binding protein
MAAKRSKPTTLRDTGAILAILDDNDSWHSACGKIFPKIDLPLLTSEAVLSELFLLTGKRRVEMEDACAFLRSTVIALTYLPCCFLLTFISMGKS